jgi:hypothetical protein
VAGADLAVLPGVQGAAGTEPHMTGILIHLVHVEPACKEVLGLQVYILSTAAEDDEPLFVNRSIDSASCHSLSSMTEFRHAQRTGHKIDMSLTSAGRLNREGRTFFLDEVVAQGA